MQAVQIIEPGHIQVIETEKPVADEGKVLLKLKYVGFCGSDLSTYCGKNPLVQYPRIPGHEISGIIESIGKDVPAHFKTGMPVTVVPYTSCEQCPSCKNGRHHACQFNQTLGVQRDGAMGEYVVVPWQKVLIADGLTDQELALVEPLTVGFHAVDRGRVSDSDTVMVLGCGMIGTGAIIRASIRGAKVIAVDLDDNKLEVAKQLGAHHTINVLEENLHDRLASIVPGGPDVVIEAAGNPHTYKSAIEEVAFTGRVVCIGYVKDEVALATKFFVQKELDILGSRNATASDFRAVINYLKRKTFPMDKIISSIISPEQASDAVRQWASEPGKVFKILVAFD